MAEIKLKAPLFPPHPGLPEGDVCFVDGTQVAHSVKWHHKHRLSGAWGCKPEIPELWETEAEGMQVQAWETW